MGLLECNQGFTMTVADCPIYLCSICCGLHTISSYLFLLSYLSFYLITLSDLRHLISPLFPSAQPPALVPLLLLFYHSFISCTALYCLYYCSFTCCTASLLPHLLVHIDPHCFLVPFLVTLPLSSQSLWNNPL